jgi:hypothetical protein
VSATLINMLTLFAEVIAVCCENRKINTDTLCGQIDEFCYGKVGGTHSNHWGLKD